MSKVTANVAHPSWLRQKEIGQKLCLGYSDRFFKILYSKYFPYKSWDQDGYIEAVHGGIQNLEFSPDGSFIVAACEKHCLLLVDPLSCKMIRRVNTAHSNYVTNVKFLDSRHIATGSDDSTVAIWDARNLKTHIRHLEGHSHAVEDIEYSQKEDLLVTSGFDGSIRTWDINSYEEDLCQEVFQAYDVLRMRLSPDANKMVVSTGRGFLLVVHDVELRALARDLSGFQPDECLLRMRLHLDLRQEPAGPPPTSYSLFSRRSRNRVELITDFPREDDSIVLPSLVLHPTGSAALTWGSSPALGLEWTCVHDVRGVGLSDPNRALDHVPDYDSDSEDDELEAECAGTPPALSPLQEEDEEEEEEEGGSETGSFGNAIAELGLQSYESSGGGDGLGNSDASYSSSDDVDLGLGPDRTPLLEATGALGGEGGSAGLGAAMGGDERVRMLQAGPGDAPREEEPNASADLAAPPRRPKRSRIFQYIPRLSHFLEAPNTCKWYIKDSCFSPDGRLMAVPTGNIVKIFSFSPECSELSDCIPNPEPLPLHELVTNICHGSMVRCSKFSPHHFLIVSGCSNGNMIWHQPMI